MKIGLKMMHNGLDIKHGQRMMHLLNSYINYASHSSILMIHFFGIPGMRKECVRISEHDKKI